LLNANSDSVGLGQVHIFTDNADVLVWGPHLEKQDSNNIQAIMNVC
jgi:hypothetical protein